MALDLQTVEGQLLRMTLDTGATICSISEKHVKGLVNKHEIIFVKGIGGKEQTVGTTYMKFKMGNTIMTQKFHVLPDTCELPHAGLMGLNFWKAAGSVINLVTDELYLTEIDYSIPLIYNGKKATQKIPERCQYEVLWDVKTKFEKIVIMPQQLAEGVYLAGTLSRVKDGKAKMLILNINPHEVEIRKTQPTIYPERDFIVLNIDEAKTAIAPKKGKRWEKLKTMLKTNHLTPTQAQMIEDVCKKYSDVFHLPGDKLTTTDIKQQSITLKPGTEPIYCKQFRNPYHQRPIILEQVGDLENNDVIEDSVSAWNAPLLLVPKKKDQNGNIQYRVVIDYRKLNNVIEQDKYPLPNIKELIDQLGGSQYFTCMDLSQGYYQVELEPSSRPCTAFSTPDGKHYQLKRLPMGLSISPSAFSRVMSIALSGLTGFECLVYLDDLIIFSRTETEHMKNLTKVFERLRQVNLKVHPGKSHFMQQSVIFLGFKIDKNGIMVDPAKYEAIEKYPAPKNKKELQRFLGMANFYRQFIRNYAELSLPMANLLKKGVKYEWTEVCENAFDVIKHKLCSDEVLAYPNFKEDFILYTDASDGAIGAVLSNADNRPVHFASRILKGPEERYSVIEKELLAIVYATKIFRPYLLGRHFVIKTDHAPLKWLYSMTNPASRLTKFRLALEPFDFTVEHVKGTDNVVADALSRIGSEDLKKFGQAVKPTEEMLVTTRAQAKEQEQTLDLPELPKQPRQHLTIKWFDQPGTIMHSEGIRENVIRLGRNWEPNIPKLIKLFKLRNAKIIAVTLDDSEANAKPANHFVNMIKWLHTQKIECFVVQKRIQPKKDEIEEILHEAHILPTAGHAGATRMYRNLKRRYEWPRMADTIAIYVNKCALCKQMKHLHQRKTPMNLTTTSSRPFERVLLDIVGPINIGQQMKYALTLQDDFSKYLVVAPINSKDSEKVAETFVTKWVLRFGSPETILTDCGKEFVSELFKGVCKLLSVNAITSTAYRHETIGALENTHKTLNEYIRLFIGNKKEWHKIMPYFEFAYNNAEHTTTKYTPHEILFGCTVNFPKKLVGKNIEKRMPNSYEDYMTKMYKIFDVIYDEVLQNIVHAKMKRISKANENRRDKQLEVGDEVMVRKEIRNKTEPVRTGPYKIVDMKGANLRLDNDTLIHHDKVCKILLITTFT